jgi:hypothetical protein
MATWKKVLVEDADITVGAVTATLGEAADVSSAGTVNVVVSATDGATEGALTVAEIAFGSNAFNSTAFLTAVPNNSYQINANTVANKVVLELTGNSGGADSVSFEEANNSPIVITRSSDAIKFDIPNATDQATGVSAAKLSWISSMKVLGNVAGSAAAVTEVSILDQDTLSSNSDTALATQQSIKAYVDNAVTASGSGTVTNVIGGTNINVTSGASEPTVNLDADIALSKVGGNSGSGTDAAGSALTIIGGAGTGTGAGGDIVFKTSTPSTSGSTANAQVTAMTISDDQSVTIAGNLTVNGVTTTLDTTNLLVEDTFIALNSGGTSNIDVGIVFTGAANKVFGWDHSQESGRFGVDYTGGNAAVVGGGFTPDAWVSTVHTAAGVSSNATAALAQIGNMYINSANQDIYIYS